MALDKWAVKRGLGDGFVAIVYDSENNSMQTSESMPEAEVISFLEDWGASSSEIALALEKAKAQPRD